MRGLLIVFEGVEGSGKSTQAELLCRALQQEGRQCQLSREPGGTPIGEEIRRILLDNRFQEMHARTELLLYLASRNQHVQEKLLPAIRQGVIAVSDRYTDSSLAYQGRGRDLTFQKVSRLNKFATAGLVPDLVIVVDVPPELGLKRKTGSGMHDTGNGLDRLEAERNEFHERVRAAYLQLARRAPKRIRVFDGRQPPEVLHGQILGVVQVLLKRKGREAAQRLKGTK
jgi:dTMP kinase